MKWMMHRGSTVSWLLVIFLVCSIPVGCGSEPLGNGEEQGPVDGQDVVVQDEDRAAARDSEQDERPGEVGWDDVNDWLYQLQDIVLQAVGDSAYDLLVMDYSSDGTASGEYTLAQITALKTSPGGPKLVLAYLSIGEAEDYRYYWQSAWEPGNPDWLDAENLNWPGNYKVKYWYPEWQSIILDYLDRIMSAGFDGVYLDLVNAYEHYADGRPAAMREMVDFVVTISNYAHVVKGRPGFGIFPQNAAELETRPGYLTAVTGIGQEETYYGHEGADNESTPPAVTEEIEAHLDRFVAAGKLVLTVDYTAQQPQIEDAYRRARDRQYVPFYTVRDLDRLTVNPGHEPD